MADKSGRSNASIKGKEISLAGDSVTNQGELIADTDLNVWAHKHLANQYGGEMKANTINLESKTQVVRNGSRTPYISTTAEVSSLLNNSSNMATSSINMNVVWY